MANLKNNILDGWIDIERLSEGNIQKKNFPRTLENIDNFEEKFKELLQNQKRVTSRSGIVIYFGIFSFREIMQKMKQKAGLMNIEDGDIAYPNKFTYAMYFDYNLNFLPDKFFFTMSGYIKYKGKLPEDFLDCGNKLRENIGEKFNSNDFNTVINSLLNQYQVELENVRYACVQDLEQNDDNIHSFFIKDLEKAKKVNTVNLNRYLGDFSDNRQDLNIEKSSNYHLFSAILNPKYYPLGRFPSNPKYALTLMQQVAVNLSLNDANTIRSVNGPPGTGKTTLLKDIFADNIVEQANQICQLKQQILKGDIIYTESYKFAKLPESISEKSIVVASSNNAAVQNIVNELPKMDEIDSEFQSDIENLNYFRQIANQHKETDSNWGLFSLEGGKKDNIKTLLDKVKAVENELKSDDLKSNPQIYQEFREQYHYLIEKRQKAQKYLDKIKLLFQMKESQEIEKESFNQDHISVYQETTNQISNLDSKINTAQINKESIETQSEEISERFNQHIEDEQIVEDDLENIKLIKPRFYKIKRLINADEINSYQSRREQITENYKVFMKQKKAYQKQQQEIEKQLQTLTVEIYQFQKEKQKCIDSYNNWKSAKENHLNHLEQNINQLASNLNQTNNINSLNFDLSYDELQKSNFWFDESFRKAQSQLFIKAMAVRKQFLFDNRKHLQKAIWIWKDQSQYFFKENGTQIIHSAWGWINFTVPVISTTFASFGQMFRNIPEKGISNLFIDEAGQALPQASVGAIFRSNKVLAVGDPSQIEPVLNLNSSTLSLICRKNSVSEKYVSLKSSTQSLIDATSQFGFIKNDDSWIGIPLWVHRRSSSPMFDISNEISYDDLMVQGKTDSEGIAEWYDIRGIDNNKFVKEQADFLIQHISEKLKKNPSLADEIYVITPFKNVAYQLAQDLKQIKFTKYQNGKPINVGTVHTFQGKEAKIVYFVLGASERTKGAASWVVSSPNIFNVAVTRAKEELYIIGNKKLYKSLKNEIIDNTIRILTEYHNGRDLSER